MRPPPPLTLQCAPSRAWQVACTGVGGAAGLALGTWLATHQEWALPACLGLAGACALAGVLLGRRVAGPWRSVELRWDGREWQVEGVPGGLQVMLDFGGGLLLLRHRPRARGGARWLAISFAQGAIGQRTLRTALYSRPPEATPDLQPHVRAPDRATD
jgi:MFS family permease